MLAVLKVELKASDAKTTKPQMTKMAVMYDGEEEHLDWSTSSGAHSQAVETIC